MAAQIVWVIPSHNILLTQPQEETMKLRIAFLLAFFMWTPFS
jgi:hypothetical protein